MKAKACLWLGIAFSNVLAAPTCLQAEYTQDPAEMVQKHTGRRGNCERWKMAAYACPAGDELWSSFLSFSLCRSMDLLCNFAS